jgi:hypothetical protein
MQLLSNLLPAGVRVEKCDFSTSGGHRRGRLLRCSAFGSGISLYRGSRGIRPSHQKLDCRIHKTAYATKERAATRRRRGSGCSVALEALYSLFGTAGQPLSSFMFDLIPALLNTVE